jgi:hypothetical protein
MNKSGVTDKHGDYPLSWVRRYGQSRVFYSARHGTGKARAAIATPLAPCGPTATMSPHQERSMHCKLTFLLVTVCLTLAANRVAAVTPEDTTPGRSK